MYKGVNISSEDADIVINILKEFLTPKSQVWVFGSRLKTSIKPFSDLDLMIDCEQKPMTIGMLADLNEAFLESDLPYKVDIVDMNSLNSEFLEIINASKIIFYEKSYSDH